MLDIKWSNPYSIKSGAKTQWCREWHILPEMLSGFFEFWKKNKFKLLGDGFTVVKSEASGKWYLKETKDDVELFRNFNESSSKTVPATSPEDSFILPPYELKNKDGLRPWQIISCERLVSSINHWEGGADGSQLGSGKTYSAIGTARELNVPFVVVCPKAVKHQWRTVIDDHFKISSKCKGIINYELLIRGRKDSSIASFILKRDTGRKQFTWKIPKDSLIIWDEAHKLKNFKTKSSKCCIEAYKQGFKQLFLSATMASSPLDLKTIGICLKMFKNGQSYYDWAYAHGAYKNTWGMTFNNDPIVLQKINRYLFEERGICLRRDDIPNFPECEIIIQAYDINEQATLEINNAYSQMTMELRRLNTLIKNEESQLVIRLRHRQKIELLKTDLFIELANEGLDSGMSIILFMNYTETIELLSDKLNTKCIYSGKVLDSEKIKNLNDFQINKSRILIVQNKSGNAGLNVGDSYGKHPRLSIISPDDSAIVIKQCCGRANRENSKSKSIIKIPFCNNTIESEVVDNFSQKAYNIDKINDSDLKII